MQLSSRVLSVSPSVTLAITAKAKELKAQGVDVISLSAGEPDFDTPDYIKQASIEALQNGATRYTPAVGTLELRQAICDKLQKDQGLTFQPNQIIVNVGAKHSIFNALFALLNAGDEVLIPAPYWLSYPEMVTLLGGESKFITTDESTGFKLTPELLKQGVSEKTKVLILNSPSNPTGAVYSKEELQALIEVLKEFPEIVVISDEIYEKLVFEGAEHISIATLDEEIAKRTIIINGMSKAYAMTGWRLGYTACPNAELAKAIGSLQSHSTSNPTAFAQVGGIVALEKAGEDAQMMCETFERRKALVLERVSQIPKISVDSPQGAFYMFINIEETGMSSVDFSAKLLEEAHVAVVPGEPFGSDKHIRISFATSDENLEKAFDRITTFLS